MMSPSRMLRTALLLSLLMLFVPSSSFAARTPGEVEAIERKQAVVEAQARQEIETLFNRLCPGRCELIDVNAVVQEPKIVGQVTPGFGGEGTTGSFDVELKRIESRIMIDSKLPRAFRANIPRMLQFRLSKLAPSVVISPTVLEFPKPQAPPMPELKEPPKPEPEPPKPEPTPEPEPPKEEAKPEQATTHEPTPWYQELWAAMLPYLPTLVIILLLSAIAWVFFNRWRAMQREAMAHLAQGGQGETDRQAEFPDLEALRADLKQSRSVQNDVLRGWLRERPDEVAVLVSLLGAEILSDVKRDPTLKASVSAVSEEVTRQDGPVEAREATRIERIARARLTAARVLHTEQGLSGDWEFVQGLALPTLQRLMQPLGAREKSYTLGKLPAPLRAAYLEQLGAKERRELFVETSSAQTLSKEESISLAVGLRQNAESIAHIGGDASGQATIILEMLQALELGEQEDTLRALRQRRPEVAQSVLTQVCLESAILVAPTDAVADVMHRIPVETLSNFLRGTRADIAQHMINYAPGNVRQAVAEEFELGAPLGRGDYIEARDTVSKTLTTLLQRDGVDLVALNVQALSGAQSGAHVAT